MNPLASGQASSASGATGASWTDSALAGTLSESLDLVDDALGLSH